MRKKLAGRRGETLSETLVSLLVFSLAMLLLAGGILTASQMNLRARDAELYVSDSAEESEDVDLLVGGSTVTVRMIRENGGVCRYEAY